MVCELISFKSIFNLINNQFNKFNIDNVGKCIGISYSFLWNNKTEIVDSTQLHRSVPYLDSFELKNDNLLRKAQYM